MKAIGIVRKVDELGRIVIPKELRNLLGFEEGYPLEILADEKGVYLRKYQPGCVLCGGMEDLKQIGDRRVCSGCIEALSMTEPC